MLEGVKTFLNGTCIYTENTCWFLHVVNVSSDENISNGKGGENKNTFFHMAQDKTPPDYLSTIMKLIENLSKQVKNLETKSMYQS